MLAIKGEATPPTKWQNAPIELTGASHKRVRWDSEDHVYVSMVDFDAADQGADDFAAGQPVGTVEAVLNLSGEGLQAADQRTELVLEGSCARRVVPLLLAGS